MQVQVLGTADNVNACECCGRTGLKHTVALSIDSGAPVYFGVVCAAKASGRNVEAIESEAKIAERHAAADAARKHGESMAPWFAFLLAYGTGDTNAARIASLGGFSAARARFGK